MRLKMGDIPKIIAVILSIFIIISCQKKDIPTVTTESVSNILMYLATSGVIITDDGNAEVVDWGVCWSITHLPSISNSLTHNGSGLGFFESSIKLQFILK
jgi:hypothetical protein